jgi:transcriptional regulator of heat shock response
VSEANRRMTDALTARQTQILKALVDEYIEAAEPIGSETLEKKYNFGVSPATIRNEMVALTSQDYLRQPHTSAGRIPSPKAMKFYIDQLMEEKHMSLTDEVKAKEEVWDVRENLDSLMEEATQSLAARTGSLAVGTLDDGNKTWHAGYANLFSSPEFSDLAVCQSIFSLIEEAQRMNELFFQRFDPTSPFDVLFGEDLGWPNFSPVGVVATHFRVHGKNAALGIIGPARLSYSRVIPIMKYFSNMITEIAGA